MRLKLFSFTLLLSSCAGMSLPPEAAHVRVSKSDPALSCVEKGAVDSFGSAIPFGGSMVEAAYNTLRIRAHAKGADFVRVDGQQDRHFVGTAFFCGGAK